MASKTAVFGKLNPSERENVPILTADDVVSGSALALQNRTGVVTGVVRDVVVLPSKAGLAIRFESNSGATIVGRIAPIDYGRFPDLRVLKGRHLVARGTFHLDQKHPSVWITSPGDLKLASGGRLDWPWSPPYIRPRFPNISEDRRLLRDAVAAWNLSDGAGADGSSDTIRAAVPAGPAAKHRWGIWLNDRIFGKVLDFSTEGSYVQAANPGFSISDDFAISAWIKAPPRDATDRVIVSQGTKADGWCLKLDSTRTLIFENAAFLGAVDSGFKISTDRWHHVLVSRNGSQLSIYVDGADVHSVTVARSSLQNHSDIFIGSAPGGLNGFEGSIARVRIFRAAKTPAQVTSIALLGSDSRPRGPTLTMRHGIAIDRRQYAGYVPPEYSKIYPQDITNCRNMGFDHIKVLFTPNHLMNDDGSIIHERLWYMQQVVDRVVGGGMHCLICIHPEVPFKQTYLIESDRFERLVKWYRELAVFISQHWRADQVALQLMTEPYANQPENRWTWMSDRMYGAVRNVLPDHTIVTSADQSGNLERLMTMRPVTDPNLVYSFTTYQPYTAGFNIGRTALGGTVSFWSLLDGIPYPAGPGSLTSGKIEIIINDVPAGQKAAARSALQSYASGASDGGEIPNIYGGFYDVNWHRNRARTLTEWSRRYGGVNLMCVEFGCLDSITATGLFTHGTGSGVSDADRIDLVRDLRKSFEAYGIGWTYWSYNDPFTVFLPKKRVLGQSPDAISVGPSWFDYNLLRDGLGLTPTIVSPAH